MSGIYFLMPTLIAIVISMMIVRAGAIALMMTGMDFEKAKFQALSAFSGTGFTTHEAERVVNNLRRRKIVSWLMIMGNAGIVTVIVTATSSFNMVKGLGVGLNGLVLLFGIWLIYIIAKHSPLARYWEEFAQSRLERMKIFDDDSTVDELLHITEGYGVVRIQLFEGSHFIGQTLSEINNNLEESYILGVEQNKEWLPTPRLNRKIKEGDYLVIYGKVENLYEHFSQ